MYKRQILGTGGTIASFVDYKTGAVSPAITAEQLVNSVSSLRDIANIEAEPLNNDISENISKDQIDEDDDGINLEPNTESLIGSKKRSMYKENGEMDHEYLDIPAFLRNQQD